MPFSRLSCSGTRIIHPKQDRVNKGHNQESQSVAPRRPNMIVAAMEAKKEFHRNEATPRTVVPAAIVTGRRRLTEAVTTAS